MYKNYFYLLRAIRELKPILVDKQIVEAYTQEKDKLFIHIPLNDKPNFHLIISVNPQKTFVTYKDEHHKAKKNTINFFNDFFPVVINDIKIALGDRIISIEFNNSKIIIVFRGGQSNIFLIDSENSFHAFKKIGTEERSLFEKELLDLTLINHIHPMLDTITNISDEDAIRKLPFIGKDILKETENRKKSFAENILNILNEIQEEDIAVYYDDIKMKPCFYPVTFKSLSLIPEGSIFHDYFSALNKYFNISFRQSNTKNVRKEIEKFLSSEIEKYSNKLNNLKARIDSGSKEVLYRSYGNLLLSNIHLLRKGMKEVTLENEITHEINKIMLDEKKSPNMNVQHYFEKSRSEKIEFEKSKQLHAAAEKVFNRLLEIRTTFEQTEDEFELLQIRKELKMKEQSINPQEDQEKISFRHYVIDGKYHIYVGKDSRNNDLLTTKFAKQNDFWFHARSVSGSHVVLRVENSKEPIPKNILKKTSSVAAFYSKAKTSGIVPVTYTLKKYVTKNKRHEPGQVSVTKENVLLVKPEIPSGCEQVLD